MARLAGVNVNDVGFNGGRWTEHSSSPEGMAHDLTSLFEAAGGLQAMGNGSGHEHGHGVGLGGQMTVQDLVEPPIGQGHEADFDVHLTGMLDELF
jgi:hypothetical protein